MHQTKPDATAAGSIKGDDGFAKRSASGAGRQSKEQGGEGRLWVDRPCFEFSGVVEDLNPVACPPIPTHMLVKVCVMNPVIGVQVAPFVRAVAFARIVFEHLNTVSTAKVDGLEREALAT